ncbi:MAG: mycofactocin precursor MftA [Micrococcaceae bacterium]
MSSNPSPSTRQKDTADVPPVEPTDVAELIEEVSIDGMCGVY